MILKRFSRYAYFFLLLLALSGCEPSARSTTAPTVLPPVTVVAAPATSIPTVTAAPSATPALPDSTQTMAAAQTLPLPTATTIAAGCGETHGKVESQQIESPQDGMGTAFVYLPPCFSTSPVRRYPVLYLLHGVNTDNTQWVQIGAADDADTLIDAGIAAGTARPFLIVMPKEALYTQDPNASKYGGWIVNTLMPWIDQHYPTCAERSCRAIGGLSRGGSWAFRIGLTDWQDFGAVGMDSFAPFYGDFEAMPGWFQQIPPDQRPRIWLDAGRSDSLLPNTRAVASRLDKLGIPYTFHVWEGAHNRAYWRVHVPDYLLWYAQVWK